MQRDGLAIQSITAVEEWRLYSGDLNAKLGKFWFQLPLKAFTPLGLFIVCLSTKNIYFRIYM